MINLSLTLTLSALTNGVKDALRRPSHYAIAPSGLCALLKQTFCSSIKKVNIINAVKTENWLSDASFPCLAVTFTEITEQKY